MARRCTLAVAVATLSATLSPGNAFLVPPALPSSSAPSRFAPSRAAAGGESLPPQQQPQRSPAGALQMVAQPPVKPQKLDKINLLKQNSEALREPLRSQMQTEEISISHDAYQILKFHGSYMQDDRSLRKKGKEKAYSFMLRLKMPAGVCSPELYTLLDDLSREYGHGHLRLTTRQTFQLHGVAKHNLKTVIKSIMQVGSSTVGGCGDVNRNIMCTPAPIVNRPEYVYARQYTKILAELLRPLSSAFTELWLDGEKAATVEWRDDVDDALKGADVDQEMVKDNGRGIVLNHPVEPLYGDIYMPREL
ncbi:unnamed protein product, partial [Ectocarpus sp. 4 AP-2014]